MVLITSYNYSYWGESKPTNITGGPHIVDDLHHLGQLSTQKRSVAGFRTRSPSASLPGIPGHSGHSGLGKRRFRLTFFVALMVS